MQKHRSGTIQNHPLKQAIAYLKPYMKYEIIALFLALIGIALELLQPWVNKIIIDDIAIAGDFAQFKYLALIVFFAFPFELFLHFVKSFLFAWIGEHADIDLKKDLFSKIQRKPFVFFDNRDTGELMSYFAADVPELRDLFRSTLVNFCSDLLRAVIFILVMIRLDITLTLIALPFFPLYVILAKRLGKDLDKVSESNLEYNAIVSSELRNHISGIRDIKAFAKENLSLKIVAEKFTQLLEKRLHLVRNDIKTRCSNFVIYIGHAVVLLVGTYRAYHGEISTGVLIAYLGYFGMTFMPAFSLVELHIKMRKTKGAASRIFQLMKSEEDEEEISSGGMYTPDQLNGSIEFKNVSFTYRNKTVPALRGVSFKINAGEKVAIVGASGSGKTTVCSLICNFYKHDDGNILVDGRDIGEYSVEYLRSQIGILLQSYTVFNATIRENLLFAKTDASDDLIETVARSAQIMDFINELPMGFDTRIGDMAVQLSGGQKQRIAIARLLLYDPKIVILDEATSALDYQVEAEIQDALDTMFKNRTSIVVAHRYETAKKCDKVIVMDNGKVVEFGTHEELHQLHGQYTSLFNLN